MFFVWETFKFNIKFKIFTILLPKAEFSKGRIHIAEIIKDRKYGRKLGASERQFSSIFSHLDNIWAI